VVCSSMDSKIKETVEGVLGQIDNIGDVQYRQVGGLRSRLAEEHCVILSLAISVAP
jgi:hypothetical protein